MFITTRTACLLKVLKRLSYHFSWITPLYYKGIINSEQDNHLPPSRTKLSVRVVHANTLSHHNIVFVFLFYTFGLFCSTTVYQVMEMKFTNLCMNCFKFPDGLLLTINYSKIHHSNTLWGNFLPKDTKELLQEDIIIPYEVVNYI